MVTIIGGGIAGSALAGALARGGTEVALFEEREAGPGGGAFLFIDDRGHHALASLGVDQAAVEAGSYAVTGGLGYANNLGRGGRVNSRGHRFWMRRNLMGILNDFVAESGAKTTYGEPITGVTVDDGGCTLHQGDSTARVEDLLVGADGIDSVVREGLEPERRPVYAGDVVLYGMTGGPVTLPSDPATLHFFAEIDSDGTSLSTLGHIWRPGDDAALWFVRIPRPPLEADSEDLGLRPIDEWAAAIRAATPSNRPLIDTFLETTEAVHVSNARNVPLEGAAEPGDSVLLVGDADHAITPAAGVGARDALEDVHAVYEALISGVSPGDAMARRRRKINADRELVRSRNAR
ncbi:FAD-dependent monooxygenase [Nocardia sp. NBC_01503]|uniref:FAD-dependent monooxygenase n=1 Tax=Nocardia sp. NBC_01503 TaxID=2975997 RepID=UPI002E7BDE3C|nr:FAD-dependent monooxygenase [Nocardia sp. NBC_01503]WTL31148.1 FAD-dependent monooxygenase [Nocardia sp. NBC_01503]